MSKKIYGRPIATPMNPNKLVPSVPTIELFTGKELDGRHNVTIKITETDGEFITEQVATITDGQKGEKGDGAPDIVCEEAGSVIAIKDSNDRQLRGLTIYGKTTQDDTPTPEAPVELVTAGKSGTIKTIVAGKNLVPYPYYRQELSGNTYTSPGGIDFTVNADGSVTANGTNNGTGNDSGQFLFTDATELWLPVGEYILSTGVDADTNKGWYLMVSMRTGKGESKYAYGGSVKFTVTEAGIGYISWRIREGNTANNLTIYPQLEVGSVATAYEKPVKTQTLTASTPNGLPGIPVSSGGNYTDKNGQKWICDEIDFACGVYVQRIKAVNMVDLNGGYNGSNFWFSAIKDKKIGITNLLCSHYPVLGKSSGATRRMSGGQDTSNLFIYDPEYSDWDVLRTVCNDAVILYELAAPIETALSAEELATYAALHTNKPNTTVYNNAWAEMKLVYNADTKTYIDNKFAELQNAILSAGANV